MIGRCSVWFLVVLSLSPGIGWGAEEDPHAFVYTPEDFFDFTTEWQAETDFRRWSLDFNQKTDARDLLTMLQVNRSGASFIPLEMVDIPAGSYSMGNSAQGSDAVYAEPSEFPAHDVSIDYDFQLGKYEVTNGQFARVLNWAMDKGYLRSQGLRPYMGGFLYYETRMVMQVDDANCDIQFKNGRFHPRVRNGESMADHPVKMVTWSGAVAFCNFLSELEGRPLVYAIPLWAQINRQGGGYRLPSESEWEYACRGGSSNPNQYAPFSFGDDPTTDLESCDPSPNLAQFMVWCGNTPTPEMGGWSHPVGQTAPNPFGLFDMHGNIREWCMDHWRTSYDYEGRPDDGNSNGIFGLDLHVLRGGGFLSEAAKCRTAARENVFPGARLIDVGFRIARTVPEEPESMIIEIPNLSETGRKLELVRISAGQFQMGSPTTELSRIPDFETPLHPVSISKDFYIAETEVTQAQWQAVMGINPATGYGHGLDYPVYYVSRDDIVGENGFLARLTSLTGLEGFRLPTEAEWEYACRAGTDTRFSFGNSRSCGDEDQDCPTREVPGKRSDFMWYAFNRIDPTFGVKQVGLKFANQWGLHDMHGNLWEWCEDWFQADFYGQPAATEPDPVCLNPASGLEVVRGGDWDSNAGACRSAMRYGFDPAQRYGFIGFRIVMTTAD